MEPGPVHIPAVNVAGRTVEGVPYVPEFFTPFHAYMKQIRGCNDKWEPYFHAYETHCARFRGKTVTMMEVGVQSGGSMAMWRAYFGPGLRYYDVDINPQAKQFESEWPTIVVTPSRTDPVGRCAHTRPLCTKIDSIVPYAV